MGIVGLMVGLALRGSANAEEPTSIEPNEADVAAQEEPAASAKPDVAAPAEGSGAPGPALIDRVMAVVGDRLITASDVSLEEALRDRDHPEVPVLRTHQDDPVHALVDYAVVRGLAGNASVYQPTPSEVRLRLDALRASFEAPAAYQQFLQSHGLDEDRIAGILYSRMVVERYIHRNIGLAAEAAGEDDMGYQRRFDSWIVAQRDRTTVRMVAESRERDGK